MTKCVIDKMIPFFDSGINFPGVIHSTLHFCLTEHEDFKALKRNAGVFWCDYELNMHLRQWRIQRESK